MQDKGVTLLAMMRVTFVTRLLMIDGLKTVV